MFWGTHIALPVLAASSIELLRLRKKKARLLTNTQIRLIGLAGILPDVLWPHFSLHSRHNSWTHTLWFLIAVYLVVLIASRRFAPSNWKVFSALFVLGSFLHILADGFAGGVSFLYPLGEVYGGKYIPWNTWLYSDIVFVAATVLIVIFLRKKSSEITTDPKT